MNTELIQGEVKALSKRRITVETCARYGYMSGTYKGKSVQIANYRRDGEVVAQHLRYPDKQFGWLGDSKNVELFGQHTCKGNKRLVITEGEIDCLSISQVFNNKWDVCSIPSGSKSARKSLKLHLEWIEGYEDIVLAFDDDEPGKEAVEECAVLFSPGKLRVATWNGCKDANELLMSGKGADIAPCIFNAKAYRPDGLVSISDIMEEIRKPIEYGLPWCIEELSKATYGRRLGELYAFGAGTGVGKTDFLMQQAAYDVTVLKERVGLIFLEQKPKETGRRLAGKTAGKLFHIPDSDWTELELDDALRSLDGKVTFYDNFGQTDWDVVKAKIRYMVVSDDIKLIYLDHLTAMADTSNERESIEQMMKEMAGLANELQCIIHFVSHLATPEGKPHEEGGRVMIKHFKGSRAIGFWSYFMFGIERNQQSDDPIERSTSTLRTLKDRYTGRATGLTIRLRYNPISGISAVVKEEEQHTNKGEGDF